ncbi:MAG: efflux RND transporter permease subunit [Rhodospirillales bacterium]|nr:efflux RND transporter permease subunit [Rhodospirillales bacterium]
MTPSDVAIRRPVATTLLTLGVALAGMLAFFLLPVSPLPEVDFPTIFVQANLPGASPETVATSVATPLERHLGQIANVTEMTSTSTLGSTRIILQFGLDRDINGAARDVQAAINAARADLPVSLRSNPTYRKVNPADSPILVLSLTSPTRSQGQIYDVAAAVFEQKLSQVSGVGQVRTAGSSLPAVRVALNPHALFSYGISLEDVRAALASANANMPKGVIDTPTRRFQVYTNDQARTADAYRDLVIAYRDGAPVHLADVATVTDSVEDLRNQGLTNGKPAVLVIIYRQPGANILDTVGRIRAVLPQMEREIPRDIDIAVTSDRTGTIRASLHAVELALVIAVVLVVGVVLVFLRDPRAAFIPAVAVPVSLIGTFGAMYLLGFSLNTLSLMALTVATGFVVDDAVVVLENVTRHLEAGMSRMQAALRGAREVGFTVISMSLSLIAVFIPILLMGGIVGRLFREFAMTISIAILISLVISLTTTPMMCAYLLRARSGAAPNRFFRLSERAFAALAGGYAQTLGWALARPRTVLLALLAVIGLNVYLFAIVPKGLFPQQDTGRVFGGIRADQNISFQAMRQKLERIIAIVKADPAVDTVVGFTGGFQTNSGFLFTSLRPRSERDVSADGVIARLRPKLAQVAGAGVFLQSGQDIRAGGRPGNAQYQYTLEGDDLEELQSWGPRLAQALRSVPEVKDVDSDQQDGGLQAYIDIDRATASRFGLTVGQIDNTLYDAFGQRQVSTIYNPMNQYHVVMEVAAPYRQTPDALHTIYVATSGGAVRGSRATNAVSGTVSVPDSSTSTESDDESVRNQRTNQIGSAGRGVSTGAAVSTAATTMIPLAVFARFLNDNGPLAVNHEGHFVATTLSFNVPEGVALGIAVAAIERTMREIGMPTTIRGSFAGTAKIFQSSLNNQPMLILLALFSVYIVLGILYESYVHPLTILSTLPSAGLGALLALLVCHTEFSLIALVGVILLIGIVKKNAIMMIDFALDAERTRGLRPRAAIHEACLLRFRPIMMTTAAALLGALPLALDVGEGGELRQPLGIAIVGGLLVSQLLTLYTTPVVYLSLDRLRTRWRHATNGPSKGASAAISPAGSGSAGANE